jgi:hypothetical protein
MSANERTPGHEVGVIIPLVSDEAIRWIDYAGQRLAQRFRTARTESGTAHMITPDGEHIAFHAILVVSHPAELRDLDLTLLYEIGMVIAAALKTPGVAITVDGDYLVV